MRQILIFLIVIVFIAVIVRLVPAAALIIVIFLIVAAEFLQRRVDLILMFQIIDIFLILIRGNRPAQLCAVRVETIPHPVKIIRILPDFIQNLKVFLDLFHRLLAAFRDLRSLFRCRHIGIHIVKLAQGRKDPVLIQNFLHDPVLHKIADLRHQHIIIGKAGSVHFFIGDLYVGILIWHKTG